MVAGRIAVFSLAVALLLPARARAADLQVVSTVPAQNRFAPGGTTISITFDQPLLTSSVTSASFRVFGRADRPGLRSDRVLERRPDVDDHPVTSVLRRRDRGREPLPRRAERDRRDAAPQRRLRLPVPGRRSRRRRATSSRSTSMSNRIGGAADAHLRRGAGRFRPRRLDRSRHRQRGQRRPARLHEHAPTARDSTIRSCARRSRSASSRAPTSPVTSTTTARSTSPCPRPISGGVWIAHGAGDGTFDGSQSVLTGSEPHGVAVLDVDGDGDPDIVNAVYGDDTLALLLNDGTGTFGAPTYFGAGCHGPWGLGTADMNDDGIFDLVAGCVNDQQGAVLLGNGDGTFTAKPAQRRRRRVRGRSRSATSTATASSTRRSPTMPSGNGAIGARQRRRHPRRSPSPFPCRATRPASDLADLDGDGDLDWVLSSFGAGLWRIYVNDGAGHFTFDQDISRTVEPVVRGAARLRQRRRHRPRAERRDRRRGRADAEHERARARSARRRRRRVASRSRAARRRSR